MKCKQMINVKVLNIPTYHICLLSYTPCKLFFIHKNNIYNTYLMFNLLQCILKHSLIATYLIVLYKNSLQDFI